LDFIFLVLIFHFVCTQLYPIEIIGIELSLCYLIWFLQLFTHENEHAFVQASVQPT